MERVFQRHKVANDSSTGDHSDCITENAAGDYTDVDEIQPTSDGRVRPSRRVGQSQPVCWIYLGVLALCWDYRRAWREEHTTEAKRVLRFLRKPFTRLLRQVIWNFRPTMTQVVMQTQSNGVRVRASSSCLGTPPYRQQRLGRRSQLKVQQCRGGSLRSAVQYPRACTF